MVVVVVVCVCVGGGASAASAASASWMVGKGGLDGGEGRLKWWGARAARVATCVAVRVAMLQCGECCSVCSNVAARVATCVAARVAVLHVTCM